MYTFSPTVRKCLSTCESSQIREEHTQSGQINSEADSTFRITHSKCLPSRLNLRMNARCPSLVRAPRKGQRPGQQGSTRACPSPLARRKPQITPATPLLRRRCQLCRFSPGEKKKHPEPHSQETNTKSFLIHNNQRRTEERKTCP